MVQQSSYGKIEVSYVSIFLAMSIISSLSKQLTGLITGILVTLLLSQIGNTFGYYFFYLNKEIANNEKWRNIFLRIFYFIC